MPPGIEIEDVVGEVFYKVCRDIAEFQVKPAASFRGWLLTIADRSNLDAALTILEPLRDLGHRSFHPRGKSGDFLARKNATQLRSQPLLR